MLLYAIFNLRNRINLEMLLEIKKKVKEEIFKTKGRKKADECLCYLLPFSTQHGTRSIRVYTFSHLSLLKETFLTLISDRQTLKYVYSHSLI